MFCGPIDKLQDFGSFDDTFQHHERVGEQTVDLGSFDGTFQKKKNLRHMGSSQAVNHWQL